MNSLSAAPLLASLADEALLHGSNGPHAADAASEQPASPPGKGAPRPTARWYLGEVDAARLHIPVKSAKGLMELRWALGQKPPEYLTIIADQLPADEQRHRLRFDVRNDDNWTMRARPETWELLSGKLARAALQGGSDKLPRGTKLALSAGKLEGEVHLKVLQPSSASLAAKSRHQPAATAAPAAKQSSSSTTAAGHDPVPPQLATEPAGSTASKAHVAPLPEKVLTPQQQEPPQPTPRPVQQGTDLKPQLQQPRPAIHPSPQQVAGQMPAQPQQPAAAEQLPERAPSAASQPDTMKAGNTAAQPSQPKQQQHPLPKQQPPEASSDSPSSGNGPQEGFYLRVNNPDALMLSKRLLRTLFQSSTWPPLLQIRIPGAAAPMVAAPESSTSGRLLGRKGWTAVAAALGAQARAPMQQGSVLYVSRPACCGADELRMRLVTGDELTAEVQAAAALTASTHWTSCVGYQFYAPTRGGSSGGSGKRPRSISVDALPAGKRQAAQAPNSAPAPSVPKAGTSPTAAAVLTAAEGTQAGAGPQQQPKGYQVAHGSAARPAAKLQATAGDDAAKPAAQDKAAQPPPPLLPSPLPSLLQQHFFGVQRVGPSAAPAGVPTERQQPQQPQQPQQASDAAGSSQPQGFYLRMSNPEVFRVPEQVVKQLLAELPEQVVAQAGASHPVALDVSYEQGGKGPVASFRLTPELVSALEADSGLSADLNSVLCLRRLVSGDSKQPGNHGGGGGSVRRSARGDGGSGVQLGMRLVPPAEFGRLDGPVIDPWETVGYRKRTYGRGRDSRAVQPAVQPAMQPTAAAATAHHSDDNSLQAATAAPPAAADAAAASASSASEASDPASSLSDEVVYRRPCRASFYQHLHDNAARQAKGLKPRSCRPLVPRRPTMADWYKQLHATTAAAAKDHASDQAPAAKRRRLPPDVLDPAAVAAQPQLAAGSGAAGPAGMTAVTVGAASLQQTSVGATKQQHPVSPEQPAAAPPSISSPAAPADRPAGATAESRNAAPKPGGTAVGAGTKQVAASAPDKAEKTAHKAAGLPAAAQPTAGATDVHRQPDAAGQKAAPPSNPKTPARPAPRQSGTATTQHTASAPDKAKETARKDAALPASAQPTADAPHMHGQPDAAGQKAAEPSNLKTPAQPAQRHSGTAGAQPATVAQPTPKSSSGAVGSPAAMETLAVLQPQQEAAAPAAPPPPLHQTGTAELLAASPAVAVEHEAPNEAPLRQSYGRIEIVDSLDAAAALSAAAASRVAVSEEALEEAHDAEARVKIQDGLLTWRYKVLMRSGGEETDPLQPPPRGAARAVLELGCQYRVWGGTLGGTGQQSGSRIGVYALEPIPVGSFIVEVVGELLTEAGTIESTALSASTAAQDRLLHPLPDVPAAREQQAAHPTLIDLRKKGNIVRMLNTDGSHPNLRRVCVPDSRGSGVPPRLLLMATQNIGKGSELLL